MRSMEGLSAMLLAGLVECSPIERLMLLLNSRNGHGKPHAKHEVACRLGSPIAIQQRRVKKLPCCTLLFLKTLSLAVHGHSFCISTSLIRIQDLDMTRKGAIKKHFRNS